MAVYVTPAIIDAGETKIELTGLFMYRDGLSGDAAARAFAADFDSGRVRFDDCAGSWRMRIFYPGGKTVALGDNAGVLRWYIREEAGPSIEDDCPPPANVFSTSLKDAIPPQDRKPNYSAIAQILHFGGIYGTDTIFQSVSCSSPLKYYVAENGYIEEKDKGLTPLEELGGDRNTLERHMHRFAEAAKGEKTGCTITGGFDSRLVLAHMLHSGFDPILNITGARTHVDVRIAKEIAERLGRDLMWFSDDPEGENWLDEAIEATGGDIPVCAFYRLIKRGRSMRDKGIKLLVGGLGGECYKNRYIKQDRVFSGRPNWEIFQSNLGSLSFPMSICGEALAGEIQRMPAIGLEWLQSHSGKTKAAAYLSAGYEIMQIHARASYELNSQYLIPYDPLMERIVAAPPFQMDPRNLKMEMFHREEIARLTPEIKDIVTDHGRTCNPANKWREWPRYQYDILRSTVALALRPNKIRGRVDACFQAGLSSPQCQAAFKRCKALGILAPEVEDDTIPAPIADRLFALGSML